MPIVLIVDDSKADQALISEYIQKEEIDWIVEFSDSAEEAIVRLDELAIDVLVTDMQMPGMSGYELLDHVRSAHPSVPVVLITEHDNDQMAADALDRGAASYLAKRELSTRLVEVIQQMVQVAGQSRGFEMLFPNVDSMSFRLNIANDPRLIQPLVNAVDMLALRMKLCGSGERQRIGVALDEAILNAMYHGNLELPVNQLVKCRADLRGGKVPELMAERAKSKECSQRQVHIHAHFARDRLTVTVRDDGLGFDSAVREEVANASGDKGHQGLVVIHHLMDEVSFNEAGNEIKITKLRKPGNELRAISVD